MFNIDQEKINDYNSIEPKDMIKHNLGTNWHQLLNRLQMFDLIQPIPTKNLSGNWNICFSLIIYETNRWYSWKMKKYTRHAYTIKKAYFVSF